MAYKALDLRKRRLQRTTTPQATLPRERPRCQRAAPYTGGEHRLAPVEGVPEVTNLNFLSDMSSMTHGPGLPQTIRQWSLQRSSRQPATLRPTQHAYGEDDFWKRCSKDSEFDVIPNKHQRFLNRQGAPATWTQTIGFCAHGYAYAFERIIMIAINLFPNADYLIIPAFFFARYLPSDQAGRPMIGGQIIAESSSSTKVK